MSPSEADDAGPGGQKLVRAEIGGRVQGVGYRAWTQREAEAAGVAGWVRNRLNGDVEAVLCGPAATVDALCEKLWRGPSAARVERVAISVADADDLAEGPCGAAFRQIATK